MSDTTTPTLDVGPLLEPLRRDGKDALADRVQASIHSSPYLEEMVASAMRSGNLKRITEASAWDPSAHYTRHEGTIGVNFHDHDIHRFPTLSMMVDYRFRDELLGPEEDRLVPTLAHETYHALTPRALLENREQLRLEFAEQVRKAGTHGTIDITPMVRGFQEREFMNEATAEVHGWNALMSRIEHQHGGPMVAQLSRSLDGLMGDFSNHVAMSGGTTARDQAMFRERGDAYADCVGPVGGTTPPLSAGVDLDARGMIDPAQARRWGECALDLRFYNNENFLHALATINTMRGATRFEGRLEVDTGALGVDLDAQLERARDHDGWVRQPLPVHDRDHGPLVFGTDAPRQEAPAQYRAQGGPSGLAQPGDTGDVAARAALHGQLEGTLRDMVPPDTALARPWIDRFTGAAWEAGMRAGDPIEVLVSPQGVTLRGRHPSHVASVDLHAPEAGDATARDQGSQVRVHEASHPGRSAPGLLQ